MTWWSLGGGRGGAGLVVAGEEEDDKDREHDHEAHDDADLALVRRLVEHIRTPG